MPASDANLTRGVNPCLPESAPSPDRGSPLHHRPGPVPLGPGRGWAMARVDADRNLLFGLLALQNNFVGRDALVAAFGAWVADKSRDLGQILVQQKAFDHDTHALLAALVARHVEIHAGDP